MKNEIDQEEWIEIIDPKSRQRMFANLKSGHCAWNPPQNVAVKRMVENQWWELFDSSTKRPYYYNPLTTETVWKKPEGARDIIPLAKLQLLKQNTELAGSSMADPYIPSSSSSTPRNRRRNYDESGPSITHNADSSHHAANNEFYANFCNGLASQLPDYPSSSGFQDNNYSNDHRRIRAPSTCSSRSQASTSTRSRFNNCLQEMVASQSQFAPEVTPVMVRVANAAQTSREHQQYRSYSPTSSISSREGSPDMLSQTTSNSYVASASKPNQRQSIAAHEKGEGWTKDSLKRPLLNPNDKKLKKYSHSTFKLILAYMGDKKSKTVPEQLVLSLLELRQAKPIVTDEIFLQLIKQLTGNLRPASIRKGWELLSILLFFFSPDSPEVKEKVFKFVDNNSDPLLDAPEVSISKYAKHCLKRLQRPVNLMKPSVNAITQARFHIFNPSQFGTSLEELMEMQAHDHPRAQLPWIQTTLIKLILDNGGQHAEGLFRVTGDPEQTITAQQQLDQHIVPRLKDCHVGASLLKTWIRQLPSPLIPEVMQERCLNASLQPEVACSLIDQLPALNRLVLAKIIQFIQFLSQEEYVKDTKMTAANYAMLFAPNILRSDSDGENLEAALQMFSNNRRHLEFTKTIIENYDTTFVASLE